MSDVSKTNEMIGRLRSMATDIDELLDDPESLLDIDDVAAIINEAADALATRVPVQVEPNDDRERIAAILQLRHPGNMYSTCERDADAILAAGFSRATVPDAATEALVRKQQRYIEELERVDGVGLSERVEILEAERDAALACIAKVEALHHKITRYGNDMYSISSESYADDPSSYEDMEPFDICAECYAVEKLICEECGGDAPVGHRSNWPCPTVRALTEGENE